MLLRVPAYLSYTMNPVLRKAVRLCYEDPAGNRVQPYANTDPQEQ